MSAKCQWCKQKASGRCSECLEATYCNDTCAKYDRNRHSWTCRPTRLVTNSPENTRPRSPPREYPEVSWSDDVIVPGTPPTQLQESESISDPEDKKITTPPQVHKLKVGSLTFSPYQRY